MRIGVDAMGGDFAPGVVVEGVAQALVDFPALDIVLAGHRDRVNFYLEKYGIAGVLKREEPAVEAFLPTLQKHLRNNDADAISKMIIYPIDAGDIWLENRHEFLKYYPRIFTEEKKQELLELQNKDMLRNYKGLMFSHGMWFSPIDDKAYFDVLNLPIY